MCQLHEIPLFNTDAVNQYKKKMRLELNEKLNKENPYMTRRAGWEIYSVGTSPTRTCPVFADPVPLSVMKLMKRVKEAFKNDTVHMYVERLEIHKIPDPDPFVCFTFKDKTYYFARWDEDGFNPWEK